MLLDIDDYSKTCPPKSKYSIHEKSSTYVPANCSNISNGGLCYINCKQGYELTAGKKMVIQCVKERNGYANFYSTDSLGCKPGNYRLLDTLLINMGEY